MSDSVTSLLPKQKVEDFQRLVRGASREHLRNNVDHYLEQLDRAIMAGDRYTMAWARKGWNVIWDELDRRDGISGEVAS